MARAFERNPAIAKYAEENGHEVASHCYKWQPYTGMSADEEEEYIMKAVLSFKKTSPTGKVPVGWYYGRPSARSAPLVAKVYREMGHELLYWADTYADDIPYWTCMVSGSLSWSAECTLTQSRRSFPARRQEGRGTHHGSLHLVSLSIDH